MIYFSSDWHLSHENIIRFCERPFANVQEMNKVILSNYREIVKEEDTFYYLGDFSWIRNANEAKAIWDSLPGNKIFIRGNHDQNIESKINMASMVEIIIDKIPVTLCHYPMLSWNRSHFGAISLFGHHHLNDTQGVLPGKRINVSCDIHDFKPISWEQIKVIANKLPNNWDYIEKR